MRYKCVCLRTGGCGQKIARASAHTFFSPPLTQPPSSKIVSTPMYCHTIVRVFPITLLL